MDKPKIKDVVGQIVDALEPFDPSERKRIVRAAMTILSDDTTGDEIADPKAADSQTPVTPTTNNENIHANAQRWMKANGITRQELDQVFHIENGSVQVLGNDLPGKNRKENVHNTYVLVGIASLISTGEPVIDDAAARDKCVNFGCYDKNNHAVYMKDVGNILSGSKHTGYRLTTPGQTVGAALVKRIAGKAE